jgi:hypothetical protein
MNALILALALFLPSADIPGKHLQIGDVWLLDMPASYHGQYVNVTASADAVWLVWGSSVIGPLPLAVLSKLDGGTQPASVGTTTCYENENKHMSTLVSISGTGDTLSAAVADYHENAAFQKTTLLSTGWKLCD